MTVWDGANKMPGYQSRTVYVKKITAKSIQMAAVGSSTSSSSSGTITGSATGMVSGKTDSSTLSNGKVKNGAVTGKNAQSGTMYGQYDGDVSALTGKTETAPMHAMVRYFIKARE